MLLLSSQGLGTSKNASEATAKHQVVRDDYPRKDFKAAGDAISPDLPRVSGPAAIIAAIESKPEPVSPTVPQELFQEKGIRASRALSYELELHAHLNSAARTLALTFRDTGQVCAVFHVCDRLHKRRPDSRRSR